MVEALRGPGGPEVGQTGRQADAEHPGGAVAASEGVELFEFLEAPEVGGDVDVMRAGRERLLCEERLLLIGAHHDHVAALESWRPVRRRVDVKVKAFGAVADP